MWHSIVLNEGSMKQAFIFKFWVIFDKVMSVYFQEIAKKPIKNLIFGTIPDM